MKKNIYFLFYVKVKILKYWNIYDGILINRLIKYKGVI